MVVAASDLLRRNPAPTEAQARCEQATELRKPTLPTPHREATQTPPDPGGRPEPILAAKTDRARQNAWSAEAVDNFLQ
jgi:hypothetical protein